jgi:serine/threonine protein kinase
MEIYMNELITESPYELHKDMKFIEEIDHGAFGKVIHVYENKRDADMAVKVINKNGAGIQLIKKMKEEVSILKKLNHNNIVKFYGYTETNNQLLIEMEYIKYGTLSRWMKNHHKISEEEASLIIGKVLSAVEYLHSMHICHRDIKPENIMMSKENDLASIKIIDFGLSAQHFNYLSQNEYCGTFIYMAPEQIEKKLYYYSVDIWSIGILMYMLLNNGKHPFYHKDDKRKDFIKKIKLAKLNFINKISYMAKHLMHKLCEPNPSWRYSASLAIKHPWITRNPNDDIPLTFNEILNRNNNKKNGHALIMISIFLNYAKKNNNIYNTKNNTGNTIDSITKKKKLKNKIYIINNEYINNCNTISKKEREKFKEKRQRYFEALSTDEEDSFEKKQNNINNSIINIKSLKKINKSSEKNNSPMKKIYAETPDDEEHILKINRKLVNKKKLFNFINKEAEINIRYSSLREKNKSISSNIHLLSVPNNTRKDKDKDNNNNISEKVNNSKINPKFNNNLNKESIRHMSSNKFINRNMNLIRNNIKIYQKDKSKSISKFFLNKNIQKEMMHFQLEQFINKSKEFNKENHISIYQSSKNRNHNQLQQILPHIPTLSSQVRNKNNNNRLNNIYAGSYSIKPLVLPFIGFKNGENRNKMI